MVVGKKIAGNILLPADDIIRIENDERSKFGKESNDVVRERLNLCERTIENAKKVILEFETRASALRQIIRQNHGGNEARLFSICPMCETLYPNMANICSNCGFTENDYS